jgi:histidinol-phosphate aminotransferase
MKGLVRKEIREITPYITGKPIEEIRRELGVKGEIIKLASNENPMGPSPLAIEVIEREVKNLHYYPDGTGYALREKLAERLGMSGEEIILGAGSCEVIELIGKTFVSPGDEVISSKYAFTVYQLATRIVGGKNIVVPANAYGHDLKAMRDAITDNTKVIFIANPNNPTGTMNTAQEISKFLDSVPDDVVVVIDEAYYEYIEREDYPKTLSYVKDKRNLIILRTFSKVHGLAGLRIGFGIAKKDLIQFINQVREPFNTSRIAQDAALAAIDDQEHIRKSVESNKKEKQYFYEILEKEKLSFLPSEGNFVTLDLKMNAQEIFHKLMCEGVVVRPLEMYDMPNAIRVTVGTRSQIDKFVQSIKKVFEKNLD